MWNRQSNKMEKQRSALKSREQNEHTQGHLQNMLWDSFNRGEKEIPPWEQFIYSYDCFVWIVWLCLYISGQKKVSDALELELSQRLWAILGAGN